MNHQSDGPAPSPESATEPLTANARIAIDTLGPVSGMDFGFDAASVRWLEGYMDRLRGSGQFDDAERASRLLSVLGSWLGECIIRCHGGRWEQRDGGWCVAFNEHNAVYPFAKLEKQMENGLEDGIASFFDAIPVLYSAVLQSGDDKEKPL